ncbi:MAG TPA: PEPxxWA-CTERM sorting domain-containing protein [Sphingomicrobium sp.]|jgi:hypothetical protein
MFKTLLFSVALMAGSAASAAVSINFNSATGNLGTTHTYTSGTLSVVATGYSANGSTAALYGKNGAGDEKGLGLAGDPTGDNEIYYPGTDFIQLNVSNLISQATGASFFMGSSTSGETWKVYGSNTAGVLGAVLIASGSDELLHALTGWGQYTYYDFVATGTVDQYGRRTAGNVLLGGLSVAAVPEPATWAMMLLGFAGIGVAARRRRGAGLAQIA